ncbi:hypothetical protein Clacol_007220 [Clathrus columnatus]|uniref:Beta-xylosidase C-terminal Concanavalin A-like domain-containing protein n=1 Tax=Clathrus columnatus TaxID=1419009 RepID=A0AAV5AJV1_9AGAM|nr:hypothetical protein Clacol_007220 [Clathrus columnatus]
MEQLKGGHGESTSTISENVSPFINRREYRDVRSSKRRYIMLLVVSILLAFTIFLRGQSSEPESKPVRLGSYNNPVIPGFHPDPSCHLVEEFDNTFFCVTSSFNSFPGVPVLASKDLIHFKQIGNVINNPNQLPDFNTLDGATSGIWAATIRYNNGTFWVTTTMVYDNLAQDDATRWDNIIFHTTDPYSDNWSDPVHFTFEGYDVSPFWDSDGKTYIQASHAWQVYPMIQQFEMDFSTGEMGEIVDLWTGTGGIAPEGPHLMFKDGYYYLMIAEGGTGLGHEVDIARSRNITGPYESNPANPVLTNANTTEYEQTVGHADLILDTNGNWWAVALATRSGPEYLFYPMGRETILTSVTWKDGEWPVFDPARTIEQGPLLPTDLQISASGPWIGGSEVLTFEPGSSIPKHFVHNRMPDPSAYIISPEGHPNSIGLVPSELNLTALDGRSAATPQTFVGRRQEHVEFVTEVTLDFNPKQDQEEAGVTVFLNQGQHFDLGIVALTPDSAAAAGFRQVATSTNANELSRYIRLRTISANSTTFGSIDTISQPNILSFPSYEEAPNVQLQIDAVNNTWYAFRYKTNEDWQTVGWGISSEVSGGFVGTIVGMFATGNGIAGKDTAYFSEFSYQGNDAIISGLLIGSKLCNCPVIRQYENLELPDDELLRNSSDGLDLKDRTILNFLNEFTSDKKYISSSRDSGRL